MPGVGLLQDWLDEPDESIARFAKAFYVTTYLFLAVFAWQVVLLLRISDPSELTGGDAAAPIVSLLLAAVMYALALDGRRSYKALKAKRGAEQPPTPKS